MSILQPPLPDHAGPSCYWPPGHGAADSLAIAAAAPRAAGPLLVVVDDNESAEQLLLELKFFCQNLAEIPVFSLPDWETLPYDSFSPHQDIVSDRLSTLYRLPTLQRGILVVSVSSLMHRLPPRQYVAANSLDLKLGQSIDIAELRQQLILAGYSAVDSVYEHGEFAVRGSIIDLFPMGSPHPFRLDLLDEELDSIRVFEPESQRSSEQVESIKLLAGREFPLDEAGIMHFRAAFRERFDVDLRQCPLNQDVSDGLGSPGLEYYLALFFSSLNLLSDYLPENTTVIRLGDPQAAGEQFWSDIEARFEDRK
ncbi:MAG: transcription-repair coupling factor, partial [Gammaproteobacteria bacterium]